MGNKVRRPSQVAFVTFAKAKGIDVNKAADQWEIWSGSGWRDGNNSEIKNWKGKLLTFAKFGYGVFGAKHRTVQAARDRIEEARESAQERERKADEYERRKRDDAI